MPVMQRDGIKARYSKVFGVWSIATRHPSRRWEVCCCKNKRRPMGAPSAFFDRNISV